MTCAISGVVFRPEAMAEIKMLKFDAGGEGDKKTAEPDDGVRRFYSV